MGNCAAHCTSKMAFSEAHGEQPLHLVVNDSKNGTDGQKRKVRSRSRSSETQAEKINSSEQADSCKKTGAGTVRVKLVIRKEELVKLVGNGLSKQKFMEDLLVKFQAKFADQSNSVYNPYEENCHKSWKPSLESIPEDTANY